MAPWLPTTEQEMEQILQRELESCTSEERDAYERIKTPMRRVPILRVGKIESVFVLGECEGDLLIFEDIEQGFEWCQPDADGVIRSCTCSQAGLQARLYEIVHKDAV